MFSLGWRGHTTRQGNQKLQSLRSTHFVARLADERYAVLVAHQAHSFYSASLTPLCDSVSSVLSLV